MKIIKYKNRKLYNTTTSSYITLEDVTHYVKTGTDFFVVDRETNLDITTEVLRAAVAEIALQYQASSVLRALIINTTLDTEQEENYTNEAIN